MRDELPGLRALLPGARLRSAETLRSGGRCSVWRVRAALPDRAAETVIVKQFHQAGEGWVREVAALGVLPDGLGPEVIAVGDAPAALVLADLGQAGNLAEALLGEDPDRAADEVCRWAAALARLHVATRDSRAEFGSALHRHAGDLPVADSRVAAELDDAARVLDQHCGALGVFVPAGALDELHGLAHRLGPDGVAALSPTDACPDNNVRVGDRLVLIDFEGAQWRHVAWDLAYLTVPWPTCWCAWRLPVEVRERALAAYQDIAAATWPEVAGRAFLRDVHAATVGWAITSATWFLAHALGDDVPSDSDRPAPSRRAMIRHRLGVARRSNELPALSELAANLDDAVARLWGDVPLELAPAFR